MTDDQKLIVPDLAREEADAIAAISYSEQGRLLHRYLRRVLETVYDTQDPGALQSHNGRRTLARDLMRLMAEGIEARSGGTRNDPQRGDEPVLVRPGKPVDARQRTRGVGRRNTGADAAGLDNDREPDG